jgi:hypothetical protein
MKEDIAEIVLTPELAQSMLRTSRQAFIAVLEARTLAEAKAAVIDALAKIGR